MELEGLAAALAAERATENDRTVLLELLGDLEQGSHERADHTELDARVHRAIYAAAGNEFLEATLNQYANLALRIWNFCLAGAAGGRRAHPQASGRSSRPLSARPRARRADGRPPAPPPASPRTCVRRFSPPYRAVPPGAAGSVTVPRCA